MKEIRIGDTVRFLSEVGGGRVSGFRDKDTVLVEDADGFEIPMLRREVVVVDESDYGKAEPEKPVVKKEEESKPADVTFKPKPLERKGADVLNLYLSFVPDDVKAISSTSFESYFVNDSNYYLQILCLGAGEGKWRVRQSVVVEPNSKVFVEDFDHTALVGMERLCVQVMAWKEGKAFDLKPALSVDVRLDCTKFYKLHAFRPNEFFRVPNWTVALVRDDKPVRPMSAED